MLAVHNGDSNLPALSFGVAVKQALDITTFVDTLKLWHDCHVWPLAREGAGKREDCDWNMCLLLAPAYHGYSSPSTMTAIRAPIYEHAGAAPGAVLQILTIDAHHHSFQYAGSPAHQLSAEPRSLPRHSRPPIRQSGQATFSSPPANLGPSQTKMCTGVWLKITCLKCRYVGWQILYDIPCATRCGQIPGSSMVFPQYVDDCAFCPT